MRKININFWLAFAGKRDLVILANREPVQLLFLTLPKACLWRRGLASSLCRLSDAFGRIIASAVDLSYDSERGVVQFFAPAFGTIPVKYSRKPSYLTLLSLGCALLLVPEVFPPFPTKVSQLP